MIGEKVGDWVIEKRLGVGSLGPVLLVRQEGTDRRAALKLLADLPVSMPDLARRLEQETPLLQRLRHENLVQFQGAGEFKGHPYFLMEYVDGPTVAALLEEHGALPWRHVVEIAMQVCRGLHHAYLHDVVHRDLKPANLLCTAEGVVKVSECGVRRCFGETSFASDKQLLSSADYLAPEQAAGKPASRQSDLYALGVVCYQLLTGRLPFLAETESQMLQQHRQGRVEPPGKLAQGLPADLDQLILDLLQKDPAKRPASAALVEQRLLAIRTRASDDDDDAGPLAAQLRRGAASRGQRGSTAGGAAALGADPVPWPQVILFSCLLLLVVAVLTWGLWPASPETVLRDVHALMEQEAWSEAETKLHRHRAKLDVPPYQDQAAELREKIKQAQLTRNMARNTAASGFTPPTSEAERLFRQGVIEYYLGQPDRAKQTWQRLITAFDDLPTQAPWVHQARLALEAANKHRPHYQDLTDALARAEKEKPAEARKRLESLRALYGLLPSNDPKLKELLEQIDQRLKTLAK